MNNDDFFASVHGRMRAAGGRSRIYAFLMENADALTENLGRLTRVYAEPFDAFFKTLPADSDHVWLHTTSDSLFIDEVRAQTPLWDAAVRSSTGWPMLFADFDMGAGRGVVASNARDINMCTESSSYSLRQLTQFDPLTGERRSPRIAAFFLFALGTAADIQEDPAVLRLLLLAINEHIFEVFETQAKAEHANTLPDDRPEWQKNLFTGPETGCQCSRCLLKRMSIAGQWTAVRSALSPEDRAAFEQKQGEYAISRYFTVLGLGRALSVPGLPFASRLRTQRWANVVAGAPQLLTREELRTIVESDDLWNQFSAPPVIPEMVAAVALGNTFARTSQSQLDENPGKVELSFALAEPLMAAAINDLPPTKGMDPKTAERFSSRVSDVVKRVVEPTE